MTGGVVSTIVDRVVRDRAARGVGRLGARLPTFAELADPSRIPEARKTALRSVDPDRPDPANLFRVHWYNDHARTGVGETPAHLVFPPPLTGVRSPIVMALGCCFPMIGAHKVLAAYGCLVPRDIDGLLVAGRHISCDATSHSFLREIPQCWLTGQAAGAAAALAAVEKCEPRAVSTAALQALLLRQGVVLRQVSETAAAAK